MSGVMAMMIGGAVRPRLPVEIEVSKVVLQPSVATAEFTVHTDGSIPPTTDKWIAAPINTGVYHVRLVPSSGALDSGNVNVWESTTANRTYSISTAAAPKDFTGTLQISADGGASILTSCPVSLHANTITP